LLLLGALCFAWVGVTWMLAALYQSRANAELDRVLASKAGPSPAGPPEIGDWDRPADALVGRLAIPRLGFSAVVLEGDDAATLDVAVGHLPDTALPWEEGNAALAAHRDTVFRPLERVRVGDEVQLATRRGEFAYRVRRVSVVEPDDVSVLTPTEHVGLTLITCYPFRWVGSAPQRYIVQAERITAARAGFSLEPWPGPARRRTSGAVRTLALGALR
jgi:LPXTG-site transpeptidase (sortase) family protein